jgi:hypothetical protein
MPIIVSPPAAKPLRIPTAVPSLSTSGIQLRGDRRNNHARGTGYYDVGKNLLLTRHKLSHSDFVEFSLCCDAKPF